MRWVPFRRRWAICTRTAPLFWNKGAKCSLINVIQWRGFRYTLKSWHANCAGPPPMWMHGRNCVSGQPVLDETCPGGSACAIVHPVFRCFQRPPLVEAGDGRGWNGRTGWHALGVPGTALYTDVGCTSRLHPGGWATERQRVQHWPRFRQNMITKTHTITTTQTTEAPTLGMWSLGKALDIFCWHLHYASDTTR